jgi:membrane protease subunit (stomatin/prohibitin family)
MSIWNSIKSTATAHAKAQFLDVIQWMEEDRNVIVYRYPVFNQAIQDGGKLVVREGQSAVFLNEGKMSEAFGPGTWEISTRTKAISSFFESIKYALNYPYKGDIFFVSTRRFTEQKWGTPGPIPMMDAQLGPVEVRAFGVYEWRVTDPAAFLRELVGNMGLFTTEEIESQLRRKLASSFVDTLGEMNVPVLTLARSYSDLGDAIRERISPKFEQAYGIQLTDFIVERVSLPPEVSEAMKKRASMNVLGDMNQYAAFERANAIGGMVEAAKTMAARPGASNPMMDAGMGLSMGQMMGGMMGGMAGGGMVPPGQVIPGMGGAMPGGAPGMSPPPAPPPLAVVYHYHGPAGQAQGSAADVAQRVVADRSGNHMVWAQGFPGWKSWKEVPEIVAVVPPAPPPPPPFAGPEAVFHYAGPQGQAELPASQVRARVQADPAGRHLVWKEGMAGWTDAREVPEVMSAGGPPPTPGGPPPPPFR